MPQPAPRSTPPGTSARPAPPRHPTGHSPPPPVSPFGRDRRPPPPDHERPPMRKQRRTPLTRRRIPSGQLDFPKSDMFLADGQLANCLRGLHLLHTTLEVAQAGGEGGSPHCCLGQDGDSPEAGSPSVRGGYGARPPTDGGRDRGLRWPAQAPAMSPAAPRPPPPEPRAIRCCLGTPSTIVPAAARGPRGQSRGLPGLGHVDPVLPPPPVPSPRAPRCTSGHTAGPVQPALNGPPGSVAPAPGSSRPPPTSPAR